MPLLKSCPYTCLTDPDNVGDNGEVIGDNKETEEDKDEDEKEEEEEPIDMTFPKDKGWKAILVYLISFPIMAPLWLTLPDTKNKSSKSTFIVVMARDQNLRELVVNVISRFTIGVNGELHE